MESNKKIILVSFATNDLKRSIKRFETQALKSNFYKKIYIFTPDNLPDQINKKLNNLIKKGKKRGYGYWYWKPLILMELMQRINDSEIIQYLDIGFHINDLQKKKFIEYYDIIEDSKKWLLPFQYKNMDKINIEKINFPKREEFKYTKGDIFEYFNCINIKEITHSPQFSAGNILIKKHEKSLSFLKDWIKVFEEKFEIVDDSPSRIKNFPGFIENRHDQSIYSILCKKNFLESLSAYEFDWAMFDNQRTWSHNFNYPFLAKRDLKYNLLKRFINRQIKNFKRKKNFFFGS